MTYTKLVNGVRVELTREEIEDRQAEEQAEQEKQAQYEQTEKYRDDRRAEFPAFGDQADAIHKQLIAILEAYPELEDPEYKKVKDQVLAVKAKYPKPEGVE